METAHIARTRTRITAIAVSFLVGILLLVMKFYAFRITGSSAILSDALESIINVVAAGFALASVVLSSRPPDESHPYGHGKVEYFSAGFEGALIILAAGGIFYTGVDRLLHPRVLLRLEEGLLLVLGVGTVNLVLGLALIRVGRRTDSIAVTADGRHVLTDAYTSGGLLLGLLLVRWTGWYRLDGIIACLVGLNILWSGGRLVLHAFSRLMDASSPALLERIAAFLIDRRRETWIDIHQLRAWRAGPLVHMDFHLILPRGLSLEEAHLEGKELERVLVDHFHGEASVLIHLDPCLEEDCPVCGNTRCRLRVQDLQQEVPWDVRTLTMRGGIHAARDNARGRD
ncbi:MAG: cation transporter [Deltaproteobacteria bacterium]|nr:cation transporter [Deltaproteobacteria bacterium]MBW2008532.1 cation transporter [Deltaproteobacteria bacterium]MBW2101618.1 cation transporter [Deltaproteobacteria bacterium]